MVNFDILNDLWLPKWQFAIFWSAVLDIRWIRLADDIDILVSKIFWDILVKKYPSNIIKIREWSEDLCIRLDNLWVEIIKDRIHLYWREEDMIKTAELIDWLPFVNLDFFKERKSKMWRDKDRKDLELLKKYESNLKK